MKKVTGIGGIFFRSKDNQSTKLWYANHLGLNTDQWGTSFEWRQADNADLKGYTQWSPMSENSDHMPPNQQFMINYRVADIAALVAELESEGVEIVDKIESYDYGKFVHIIDGDGRMIELWEPVDEAFEDLAKDGTTK